AKLFRNASAVWIASWSETILRAGGPDRATLFSFATDIPNSITRPSSRDVWAVRRYSGNNCRHRSITIAPDRAACGSERFANGDRGHVYLGLTVFPLIRIVCW